MLVRAEAPQPATTVEPVAYLDIGANDYLDLGSHRDEDWLMRLPPGRHMLGIIGTYGEDGKYRVAPVAQEPVAYLACDPETGEPVWGEDCVCKDNVYSPEDTGTIGRPVVFAPVAIQPVVTDEMVTRFLGWHLPQDFAPGAGISFKPLSDPLCWPIGTDLFRDPQARAMLEYVLTGVQK